MCNESTEGKLCLKDRAELYAKLADRARARYESFRTMFWRVNFALWTLFAVGAGVVFTADVSPTFLEAIVGTAFVFATLSVYGCWWLPYAHGLTQRDNRVSYWWETHIQRTLHRERSIPDQWKPKDNGVEWQSAYGPEDTWNKPIEIRRRHAIHGVDICVTFLLAALFAGALWSKYFRHSETALPPSILTVDGGSLEIDGTTKLQLGRPATTRSDK